MYQINEVKIQRLRECQVDNPLLDMPEKVVNFWNEHVKTATWFDADVECSVVFILNSRRKIISFSKIATGTLDTILLHSREVFKIAIVQNAAFIILSHNHPSGDSSPSEADIKVTRELVRAGQLLKIEVLDHVIIGDKTEQNKGYSSLRELGYFYS